MADLFNFATVEEKVSTGEGSQKYIYPGIRHQVVIKNVSEGKTPSGTPFIEVEMYSKEGGPETAKKFPFYTSPAAIAKSMEKIKHIATKIVKEEALNKATSVEELRDLLKGGVLRMKFTGEEYKNANNEIKEKALIGLAPFAEAIEDGAEHAPIADADTKLKFDKNNTYDFKKLVESGSATPDADTPEGGKKLTW
jgi:hypothetical protein